MSATGLLSVSTEIWIQILASCDTFEQAVALSSTCKDVHAAWVLNAPSALEKIGRLCIPAFDEAVVASRSTEIAKAALLDSKLPPKDVDIAALTLGARKPQLTEMVAIFGLQRLVEATERSYLRGGGFIDEIGDPSSCVEPGEPSSPKHLPQAEEWERACRAQFHRAVYRVLLAGSVLAGWYMEPFSFKGVPNRLPPGFPAHLKSVLDHDAAWEDREEKEDPWEDGFRAEDITYLEGFLPFDQDANTRVDKKQDALFGALGHWLIQSMKINTSGPDLNWASFRTPKDSYGRSLDLTMFRDGSPDEAKVLLREVMRMLVAYENLTRPMCNLGGIWGQGRIGAAVDPDDLQVAYQSSTTIAIILGAFQLEQFQFAEERGFVATQLGCLQDGCTLGPLPHHAVDIFAVQYQLNCSSGRPNHIDDADAPPPRLQLFTFLLQRYFGLRFQPGALWQVDRYQDYQSFLEDGSIFTNHVKLGDSIFTQGMNSDGANILTEFGGPHVYSFRRLN